MEKKDFVQKFETYVSNRLNETCSLLKIRYNLTYLEENFSTIINVVLFYTGYNDIKENTKLVDVYNFQMRIATQCLKEFYKDFVKEIFNNNLIENDDMLFYRVSDLNYNTSIFFGGDNFDGFNVTYTDE